MSLFIEFLFNTFMRVGLSEKIYNKGNKEMDETQNKVEIYFNLLCSDIFLLFYKAYIVILMKEKDR